MLWLKYSTERGGVKEVKRMASNAVWSTHVTGDSVRNTLHAKMVLNYCAFMAMAARAEKAITTPGRVKR